MVRHFILISFFLGLASCQKACEKSNSSNENIISVALAFPVETLDPRYATSAASSRVSKLIYAPLFEFGEDLTPEPFLAESLRALDEKNFEIKLKANLFFHDGSPLTAHDVAYTFNELGSEDVASPLASKFPYLKALYAKDDRTIKVELKKSFAPFLTDLCALGIVSKKNCQGRSQECRHEHIGSGPYRVKKWDMAKEALHLTPFAKWFEGAPKSETIFRVVRDENTRVLELISEKTDIVDSDIAPQNTIELKKKNHLEFLEIPGLGYTYLALNVRPDHKNDKSEESLTKRALANRKVRQAIAHAIDFDQIVEKILLGHADRVSGLIPNGHWSKDPDLKPLNYDPKKAQALLDEAGFLPRKNKGRFALQISTTPNRMRQSIAMLYVNFLQEVGIKAHIRVKDWSALYQDMKNGNFEMFSAVWVPVTEPDLYYWVHHSSQIPSQEKAGGNRHGYVNEKVDRLIELGRKTMSPEKRKVIYQEIEKIMLEDLPYIPLWNERRIVLVNKRVKGFKPSSTGSLMGIRKAYVENTKDAQAGL